MARTANDDPAPLKARVDPLIRENVGAEMAKKRPGGRAPGSRTCSCTTTCW